MGLKSDESIKEFTHKYTKVCVDNNAIDPDLFDEYGVKRGLRDKNGKGVLSGLTNISLIKSSEEIDGKAFRVMGSFITEDTISLTWLEVSRVRIGLGLMSVHICCCLEICRLQTN